jgi:hypothetical protein
VKLQGSESNGLTADAPGSSIDLLEGQIRSGEWGVGPKVITIDRAALDVFEQIQVDFASSSAYPEVKP